MQEKTKKLLMIKPVGVLPSQLVILIPFLSCLHVIEVAINNKNGINKLEQACN